jgi:prepilin-type N-terminal cleavage/methylation domain-containing protein
VRRPVVATTDRSAARAAPRRAGLTLIELLLVMALLAILLGTGVGFLASLDLGERAALGTLESTIRSARNASLARRASARVRLDPVAGVLWPEVLQVVGTWHFEGSLGGAFGHAGVAAGAELCQDGWIGAALCLPAGPGATAEFPVQNDPSWSFEAGFAVDCALFADELDGGTVLDAGGLFGLELGRGGELCGWVVPTATDASGVQHAGGRQRLCSAEGACDVGRWVLVRFEYDRERARLSLDGAEVAERALDAPLWRMQGPLVLGDARRGLGLSIDALSVAARTTGEPVRLPESVRLAADAPRVIAFDEAGELDRGLHASPVELLLEMADGRAARLSVGRFGTVDAEVLP